jgi:2-keto-3-deoxy-L-rhamnonate aldolase RhmA
MIPKTSHASGSMLNTTAWICCRRRTDNRAEHFKKALDTGCHGVIVPMVTSVSNAVRAVSLAKYAPQETAAWAWRERRPMENDYLKTADRRTALILQGEHKDAVKQVEKIVAVHGVDAKLFLLAPTTFRQAWDCLGQPSAPQVIEAIVRAAMLVLMPKFHMDHSA